MSDAPSKPKIRPSSLSSVACSRAGCGAVFSVYPSRLKKRKLLYCSNDCKLTDQRVTREKLKHKLETNIEIIPETGCWIWVGGQYGNGYGYVTLGSENGKQKFALAHRASYEVLVGPIPKGLTLDHKCRVRCCINPAHLEPVTHRENCLRGVGLTNARNFWLSRTHCSNGHEYSDANVRIRKNGNRTCRECERKGLRRRRKEARSINASCH